MLGGDVGRFTSACERSTVVGLQANADQEEDIMERHEAENSTKSDD